MQYLAAYALCALNGAPTKANVEATLKAAKVEIDAAKLDLVMSEMEGKDIKEVIAAGKGRITIGGGSAAPAAAAAPAAGGAAAPAAAAKKEESEEDDDFGMGGLF